MNSGHTNNEIAVCLILLYVPTFWKDHSTLVCFKGNKKNRSWFCHKDRINCRENHSLLAEGPHPRTLAVFVIVAAPSVCLHVSQSIPVSFSENCVIIVEFIIFWVSEMDLGSLPSNDSCLLAISQDHEWQRLSTIANSHQVVMSAKTFFKHHNIETARKGSSSGGFPILRFILESMRAGTHQQ